MLQHEVLPLAVLEQPCRFREAAIRALDDAGRPYRIAVETPNLTTLRAAINAGLAISCRTRLFLRDVTLETNELPALPSVACIMHTADNLDTATQRLAQLAEQTIRAI